ncbi:MAG: hypothetical protein KDI82_13600 [Gammaproteobacteria bacterium]|nr:hypothetical protein [Gammaproteobacteria bacterium]
MLSEHTSPAGAKTDSPFHLSQKLMRCEVVNRYHESSVRFVELDAFKLWQYLMSNKHGMKVGEPTLCLWVDADEYARNANVFDRAGGVEAVNRIVVDLFDAEYGFSQTITRYARAGETGQVTTILRSHIPDGLCDSDACQITVIEGRVVAHLPHRASRKALMGLEG